MFSNKKTDLPAIPRIPDSEHMLEDLNNADIDDVAFQIKCAEKPTEENLENTNTFYSYQKVKTYLDVKQRLKQLKTTLEKKEEQLKTDNKEIKKLADDIKKQAQAALVT